MFYKQKYSTGNQSYIKHSSENTFDFSKQEMSFLNI